MKVGYRYRDDPTYGSTAYLDECMCGCGCDCHSRFDGCTCSCPCDVKRGTDKYTDEPIEIRWVEDQGYWIQTDWDVHRWDVTRECWVKTDE